jgi:hypothetical protein
MINKFAIKHAKGISHVVVEAAFPEIRSLGIVRALQKTGAYSKRIIAVQMSERARVVKSRKAIHWRGPVCAANSLCAFIRGERASEQTRGWQTAALRRQTKHLCAYRNAAYKRLNFDPSRVSHRTQSAPLSFVVERLSLRFALRLRCCRLGCSADRSTITRNTEASSVPLHVNR